MPVDNTQGNMQDQMGTTQNTAQPSPSGTPPADGTQLPGGLNSDDVAAALGYITTLSQHMFHGGGQQEQDPNAPQEDQPQGQEKPAGPKDPKAEMEGFKTEIISTIQKELGGIKDMVKQAIDEEDAKEKE